MQFGKTHLERLAASRMLCPWTSLGQSKPPGETEAQYQLDCLGDRAWLDLSESRVPFQPPLVPHASQRVGVGSGALLCCVVLAQIAGTSHYNFFV